MENWKIYKGEEITTLITKGESPSWQGFNYETEGALFVTSENVRDGFLDISKKKYISKKFHTKLKRSQLAKNDILINLVGASIARSCLFSVDNLEANINQAVCLFRVKESINSKWVSYFLQEPKNVKRLLGSQGDSARANLSLEDLRKFKFSVPPLAEQKKIAEILSTWDKSIETTEKLIAAKQKLKKSLMQRLLTGSQRFPEFHGQEWKEVRLKDVFSEIRNINDGGDSHSVMTISARRGLISQQDKFNRVIAGDSLKKYTQLKRGDFAYNKGNSKTYEMGCIYQLESKESALVPFVYICFSPSEKVFSGFYKHWFLAHGLDSQLKKIITSGARGDGLLNVNSEDFFKLKIPVPPIEEQEKITAALNSCDAEINVLQSKLAALRRQKRGLMQKLLTGRVRVKTEEN